MASTPIAHGVVGPVERLAGDDHPVAPASRSAAAALAPPLGVRRVGAGQAHHA